MWRLAQERSQGLGHSPQASVIRPVSPRLLIQRSPLLLVLTPRLRLLRRTPVARLLRRVIAASEVDRPALENGLSVSAAGLPSQDCLQLRPTLPNADFPGVTPLLPLHSLPHSQQKAVGASAMTRWYRPAEGFEEGISFLGIAGRFIHLLDVSYRAR